MQRLHGTYGQAFNRRHAAAGHVFDRRFNSKSVLTDPQLWLTAAYIARNPVEAGLCSAPEAWPWSSHAAIVVANTPTWLDDRRLLSYFAQDGGDALRTYLEFVAALPSKPKGV